MKSAKFASSLFVIFAITLACNMPGSTITPTLPPDTATPTAVLGSISGTVWHDLCAVPDGPIPNPLPPGCVASGGGGLVANGILEAGEPGIAGVSVSIHAASCANPVTDTTTTDSNGLYTFTQLTAGTYCIEIDAVAPPNDAVLIPGGWTSPASTGSVAQLTNALQGTSLAEQNFGWDYQFLPAFTENSQSTPTVVVNSTSGNPVFIIDTPANCRKGPSTIYDVVTSFPKGTSLPIEGHNADNTWWLVRATATITCWVSGVTGHTNGNIAGVPFVAPPPTPIAAGDNTPPELSGPITIYTQLYYPTANCGANIFNVAIHASDDHLDSVWLSYRFLGDGGQVGDWNTLTPNDNASGGLYGFNYDLNAQATGELGGDDGGLEYQFFARDAAGNEASFPDGSVLGIPLDYCP